MSVLTRVITMLHLATHKLRRAKFFIMLAATLVAMLYYSFFNESIALNQLATGEQPGVFKPEEKSSLAVDASDKTSEQKQLKDNKYLPLVEEGPGMTQVSMLLPDEYLYHQREMNLGTWERKELYPIGKENYHRLPKLTKNLKFPKIQADSFSDGGKKDEAKLKKINEVFMNSWKIYSKHGYGHDVVLPLSGMAGDPFNGWAATLVDSLDTLYMMGDMDEFKKAVEFVKTMNFKQSYRDEVPLFENVIRILGGLIAGYDVSQEKALLNAAVEFGDFIMGAFDTTNRMPLLYYQWNSELRNRISPKHSRLSEIGSLSLEFSRLTQLTNDNKYFDAITRITQYFENSSGNFLIDGLFSNSLDTSGCKLMTTEDIEKNHHVSNNNVVKAIFKNNYVFCEMIPQFFSAELTEPYSFGGIGDSFYEYLPKMYHLLKGDDKYSSAYKQLYMKARNAAKDFMLFHPKIPNGENVLYVSSIRARKSTDVENLIEIQRDLDMQHLTCFTGGMFALGAKLFGIEEDLDIAGNITYGCVDLYEKLGIMPEVVYTSRMANLNDKYNEAERLKDILVVDNPSKKTFQALQNMDETETEMMRLKLLKVLEKDKAVKAAKGKETNPKSATEKPAINKRAGVVKFELTITDAGTPRSLPPVELLDKGGYVWNIENIHNQPLYFQYMKPEYILRPEAIESVFYMYRITGDAKWRDYGWMMFENILKKCKTLDGIVTAIKDVTLEDRTPDNFADSVESFWYSETLKYFYLLFDDAEAYSLDDYVYNTEAHPLKLVRSP